MKTVEERAREIVLDFCSKNVVPDYLIEALTGRFKLALKDQDLITKQAIRDRIDNATPLNVRPDQAYVVKSIILDTRSV